MSKKILIMAGGTGGHVFPGLAVADALREKGHKVAWLGTEKGIEARLVPAADIAINYIDVVGLRGKSALHLLTAPFKIMRALLQSLRVMRQEKPDCVLGMGGFVAGPGALAAKLMGIPLVIHEQNAVAGTTNRLLSGVANRVLQAFANTFDSSKNALTVGNPVRKNLPVHKFQPRDTLHVLVVGGSLGAKAINDVMPQVAAQLPSLAIWHQTGKNQQQEVASAYQPIAARVDAFIDDMAAAYAWADVIVCRAGAMTVSEVAAVGLPAIFIPLPHAIDDHQTANAKIAADQQAAILLAQKNMTVEHLVSLLKEFQQQPEKRQAMAEQSAKLGIRDADKKVMAACLELAQ